jgi:hypothetical protein
MCTGASAFFAAGITLTSPNNHCDVNLPNNNCNGNAKLPLLAVIKVAAELVN